MVFDDLATPTPNRARKSVKALTARPDRKTKVEKMTAAAAMIGGRRKRSASQPMGSAPRTMNALDAALTKTITPSLTPKLSRMSGASTPSDAPSRFSTPFSSNNNANVYEPPTARPCRSVISSAPTPGSRSSAKRISSSSWAACRSASAESTASARDAASVVSSLALDVLPLELRLADIMPPRADSLGKNVRNRVLISSELSSRTLGSAPPAVKAILDVNAPIRSGRTVAVRPRRR